MHIATTDDDGPGRRLPSFPSPQQSGPALRHWFPKRTEFYKFSPQLGVWLGNHVADYDLVHIHTLFSYASIVAARAAHRSGVPYVVRPLGTLTRYGVEQRRPWLKKVSLCLFEGPILQRAAAVHFTADAERDEAQHLGIPMRAEVAPLAVEAEDVADIPALEARFPALQGGGHILFLSRIDPKKNLEALIDAVAGLVQTHPTLRLAVVGEGTREYKTQLSNRAEQHGISQHIVWCGHLDGRLKAAVLQTAAVFALPSYSENFGIAAAEALLAGLPCVLGRGVAIAGACERAGGGLAVDPTGEATRRALNHFLTQPAARVAASRAARVFAEDHLSLRAMGTALIEMYERIVRESVAHPPLRRRS